MGSEQVFVLCFGIAAAAWYGGRLWFRIKFPDVYRDMQAEKLERKQRWTNAATKVGAPVAVKFVEQLFRR